MNDNAYDDMALEQIAKEKFGMKVEIDQVIVRGAPVSRVAEATLYLTTKKQLLLYVNANSRLLLADVQKIVTRMNLRAELYFPPKNQTDYFDEIGRQKFKSVFPARHKPAAADIRYYRTLAPYNPALVLISEIKNGEVRQYDTDTSGKWRSAAKFAYRRIKTS